MLLRRVGPCLVAALAVAACAGGEEQSGATASTVDAPVVSDSSSTTSTTPSPTTTAPVAAPPIQDVLVDVTDYRLFSIYQHALMAPYADPLPGRTPSTTIDRTVSPCAFSTTSNDEREDGDFVSLYVSACELPDVATGADVGAAWASWAGDLDEYDPEQWELVEPIEIGGWVGSRGVTYELADGNHYGLVDVAMQYGSRVFRMAVRHDGLEPAALEMATALAAMQDDRLAELGVETDTPAAGFAGLPEDLSLDDVLLPWHEIVDLAGADATSDDTWFDVPNEDEGFAQRVQNSSRTVRLEDGLITVRAARFSTMADAANGLAADMDPHWDQATGVEPIDGVEQAHRVVGGGWDGQQTAFLWYGDRRYGFDIWGDLPGDADGGLLDRLVTATAEHLTTLDLAAPMPTSTPLPVPDDPMLDIVPPEAFDDLPPTWHPDRVVMDVDAKTGLPTVTITVLESGAPIGARALTAEFVLGVDDDVFLDHYVPHVGELEPGTWQQRVAEEPGIRIDDDVQVDEVTYQRYFVRHDGDVGAIVDPDNSVADERELMDEPTDVYDEDLDLMLALGQRMFAMQDRPMQPASSELASRALALLDTWDARPIDGGPKLADRGDIPNSYPVIGAPNQHSPAGAVGDWYLTLDRLPGENPELAPVSMRVTLFDDDVDASGHAASILGEDHEPLAADANGGIVPMGDGGLFATVRGPWYFEIVNTSLGEINREPDPTTTPIDLLRRVATSWVEQINASGLG